MQNCPRCGFKKWLKTDKRNKDGIRRWACGRCGTIQDGDEPFIRISPKILYIDTEISFSAYYNFGRNVPSQYMSPDNIIHEYYIICWAASWVGSAKVYSGVVSQNDALNWTDKNIMGELRDLMDSADVVAGHNVGRFDIPRVNTRLLLNNIHEPEKYEVKDTLLLARKKFHFESNTLDYISKRLGFRPKDAMSGDDWRAIANTGDEKTLAKMVKYCRGDVRNGKAVYESLIGWTGTDKNFGLRTFPNDAKVKSYNE